MSDIFTADTSIQGTGGFNVAKTYFTKDNPNISYFSKAGIYNSADNEIKIFTNNIDALTIDANQKVICNGSLITNINYNNIDGKPTLFSGAYNDLTGKPTLFSGSYNDLTSKPTLFSGVYNDLTGKPTLFSGSYNDLTGKPTLSTVATSGLYNDLLSKPTLFSGAYNDLTGKPTLFSGSYNDLTGKPTLSTVATSGLYNDLLSKPTLFSGAYNDLTGKPTLFSGSYNDLTSKPTLSTVATSGLYNDLLSKPTLFSGAYNDLTDKPTLFSGSYNDLTGKPTLSTVATSGLYNDLLSKPTLFSGSYTDLTSKPDIFTKTETSNIFITSNVLSNTSNNLFQSITSPSLTNYFSKTETSNIFTTSNHIQNSLNFINYNNINNKPWISSGTNIYNSNLGNVGIGTINPISKLTINTNTTDYSVLDIQPTLWYKFDEADLGINYGSYGSTYNLTNQNVSQNITNFVKGTASSSYNGSSSYLYGASSPNINNKNLTVSFWQKRNTNNNEQGTIAFGSAEATRGHFSSGIINNRFYITCYNDDVQSTATITSTTVWNFFTVTYNKDTYRINLYINGVFDSGRIIGGPLNINQSRLWIGRYYNQYVSGSGIYTNSLIDDVRMYEVELTTSQINELYENTNNGFTINANSNISNYQLKLYPYTINNSNGFSYKLVDNQRNLNNDILNFYASGNAGRVGIGSKAPITEFDVRGESYITSNVHIGNIPLRFINSYSNAILTSVAGTNESYLQYTGNGTLNLNEFTSADLLIVGAGGNGGLNSNSGGGGAGEVIYFPNFGLRSGNLDITVGTSSTTFANRASKISVSGNNIIQALGGGDGGINLLFTSNGSITLTRDGFASFNYTNISNLNAGNYSITFASGAITLTGINADRSYPILKDGSGNNINPHLWYKFDEADLGINYGSYGSTYNLTNQNVSQNTTNFLKGTASSSYNGSSSYLYGASSPNINNKSLTISFWQKRNTNNQEQGTIAFGSAEATRGHFSPGIINNRFYITCYNDDVQSTATITSTTVWNFFTVTYNKDTYRINLYINGVFDSGRIIGGPLNINQSRLWIGRYYNQYVPGSGVYTNSLVDDIRMYEVELTTSQINELYNGRVQIYSNPTTGGSGGGGAVNQLYALNGAKFDEYKSYSSAGFTGSSSSGGNGGSALTTSRYTTTITGSSLSVGLGGSGVSGIPTPVVKTNYGDGGDGNGGLGANGIIIIRFKEPQYLQVKGIKDNANSGLILNANEPTNKYQLRLYPWSDTYQLTGIPTRGYSFRTQDGTNSYDLLNFFSSFGGRIGVKTKNPLSTFDVNGDFNCKSFFINGDEQYGILCQIVNQNAIGEASLVMTAGQGTNYTNLSIVNNPAINKSTISTTKNFQISTQRVNSYIYMDDSTGCVGIGITTPSSKLEVVGDINSISMTALTGNFNTVSTSSLALNNGNITGVNKITSVELETGPIKSGAINLQGSGITNGGTIQGTCTQARFLLANVNEWHYSQDNRNRFYFTDDGTSSHTVFRTGSTTHYFQDRDGTDYCLLDRFGISTYLEVVSGGGYDAVSVLDASVSGVYIYRRLLVKLNSFTQVHRCFCEDELYLNYDDFIDEFVGRVVVSKGKIKTALKEAEKDWQILEGKDGITIDDSHCVIELSRKKKCKAVVGVITKRNQNNDLPNRLVINSLGETAIFVVNTNGDLENGDLITTSNELGYAEKQDDDIMRNYTIGKVMIDCNFDLNSNEYKCEVIDEARDLRRAFLPIFIYSG